MSESNEGEIGNCVSNGGDGKVHWGGVGNVQK